MITRYLPRLIAFLAVAPIVLTADAAVSTYFGEQGSKLDNLPGVQCGGNLITCAGIVPAIGTAPGTPGKALADFNAVTNTFGVVGFETSSEGAPGSIGVGGRTATFSAGVVIDGNNATTDFDLGRYNMTGYDPAGAAARGLPDGDLGKWLETTTASFDINLGPSETAQAIAFFGSDFSDFGASVVLRLFAGSTQIGNGFEIAPTATSAGLFFFGVTSDTPFTKVSIEVTQSSSANGPDTLGFDEFIFGNLKRTGPPDPVPVPEPGTLALAGLSLLGLVAARRRRLQG